MSEHQLLITTLSSQEDAVNLARALVEARVVACVNIISGVRSFYRWQGKVEDDDELVLLMKTRREAFARVQAVISEKHPYELPELIALPIEAGSRAYMDWVDESVTLSS